MDNGESSSNSGDMFVEPAKKKYKQKFRAAWQELDGNFRHWLKRDETDEHKFICTLCNKTYSGGLYDIKAHAKTAKHVENSLSAGDNVRDFPVTASHVNNVKKAEIKLAAFVAEHNVAFSTVDHLTPLIKQLDPDSAVLKDFTCGTTKCTSLIRNVIAKEMTEKLIEILQIQPFSILIDESTDIEDHKILCVLVQYLSPITGKVITQLLDLISLDPRNCDAEYITKELKSCFALKNIPLQNIVGMACDNASVMVGNKKSVFILLQKECPNITKLNCICHSSALIANKACSVLPKACEKLIRGVATYVSGSAKRLANLRDFQEFHDVKKNRLVKLSATRWLCLHQCVERLLDNWAPLTDFFRVETFDAQCNNKLINKTALELFDLLKNLKIRAYILFLKYVLEFFNRFNATFQSEKVLIHHLSSSTEEFLSDILANFILPEFLHGPYSEDICNCDKLMDLHKVNLGPECETFLENVSEELVEEIRKTCIQFYKTAVKEILNRLPVNDAFFKSLKFMDPKKALLEETRNDIRNLAPVANRFNLNPSKLSSEWMALPRAFSQEEKKRLMNSETDSFWKNVSEVKRIDGEVAFPNLNRALQFLLCFPQSNAPAERIFSVVTDIKCSKRNRIGDANLNAVCTVRSGFRAQNLDCCSFEISDRHLELHSSENMYEK